MRPEDRLQVRCVMFCTDTVLPPVFWTAVEHGRLHKGTKEQRAGEWARLARKGVKKGLADLWFFAKSYTLTVELKAGANKPTEAQYAFQAQMAALGHGYEVVRSVDQLGEKLMQHGIPLVTNWRVQAMHHDAALDVPTAKPKRVAKPRIAKPKRGAVAGWNATLAARVGGK